jgi:hypothetical protein
MWNAQTLPKIAMNAAGSNAGADRGAVTASVRAGGPLVIHHLDHAVQFTPLWTYCG